jgi:hypothetical protein
VKVRGEEGAFERFLVLEERGEFGNTGGVRGVGFGVGEEFSG